MSTPRLHHYFPQFHLRQFADSAGIVLTYDKRGRIRPNPKGLAPGRIAAEANLYDSDHPQAKAGQVEVWLAASVDGPASAVLAKIVAAQSIAAGERESFARYVMSRDLRVPRTRDVLLASAQNHIDDAFKKWLADPASIRAAILADGGPAFTDEEITDFGCSFQATTTKEPWLDFMKKHTVEAASRLLAKGWALIQADNGSEFLTSDLGILKHRGDFGNPVDAAMGWSTNADGWLMPLSPTLMLAMAPGLKPTPKLAEAVFVNKFNATLASQAPEFVFARDPEVLRRALDLA